MVVVIFGVVLRGELVRLVVIVGILGIVMDFIWWR